MDSFDAKDYISSEETPCIVCLGVLQDKTQEEIIKKVKYNNKYMFYYTSDDYFNYAGNRRSK